MASFDVEIPDEFFNQINKLQNSDDVCRKMLEESAPILEKSISDKIKATHVHTGDLYRSIKAGKPWHDSDGCWVVSVHPEGKARNLKKSAKAYKNSKHGRMTSGTSLYNADKLFFLEYGTSKQAPSPILQSATKNAAADVMEKMQEVFNREVDKS